MNSVRFHAEARAELIHEVGFYTAVSRRLGERFDMAVKSAVNRATEFPALGSPYFFTTVRLNGLPREDSQALVRSNGRFCLVPT